MKQKRILLLASMASLMFGCKAQTSASEQAGIVSAPVVAAPVASEKPSASKLLEAKLKKDMPYADLRKIVLADSWSPLKTEACKENVGGEAEICDRQPEVEACSGDGHCNMYFISGDGGTKLRVGTYDDSASFWEFSSSSDNEKTTSCPSQDFQEFLKRFASDKEVQTAFTLPFIKVTELVDNDEKGYVESTTYVAKSDYKDFSLTYVKENFYVVDSAGTLSPNAVLPEIKTESKDTYMVRVPFGTEGSSYRFRNQDGCWRLAEDPEPSSP